ncbi:hypothetical protein Golax_018837, partial [Gossypium laxum]|nr:hypothetical protein [Gossypium laxum]
DLRQTEWTRSTLAHVDSKDYDVFLLPGDLSYADTHQKLWDSFGRLVEQYANQRPWMATEGNHEIEFFPWIRRHTFKAYNACWLMPYKESGSTSNLYYSFRHCQFTYRDVGTRIYDKKPNPCGPVYITIGDGGNPEGLAL